MTAAVERMPVAAIPAALAETVVAGAAASVGTVEKRRIRVQLRSKLLAGFRIRILNEPTARKIRPAPDHAPDHAVKRTGPNLHCWKRGEAKWVVKCLRSGIGLLKTLGDLRAGAASA